MSSRSKFLQLRPRQLLSSAPCAVEMTALFNCWSTSGIENPNCAELAKAVTRCMSTSATRTTAKHSDINKHLNRLKIPAVKFPRT